jgi:hypothetical protein
MGTFDREAVAILHVIGLKWHSEFYVSLFVRMSPYALRLVFILNRVS